jgi:6,7-dimethyl-8-ribityllumazine synthase
MSSKDKNLSKVDFKSLGDCSAFKVGIVRSEWNTEITEALESGAKSLLIEAKLEEENIIITSVPGTFELALGAKYLISQKAVDAVICLGCVIQGETKHNEYINNASASAIAQLSLISNVPVIYGVLTPNNEQQALDRAGGKHGNKGIEAAFTALKMALLKKDIHHSKSSIGF